MLDDIGNVPAVCTCATLALASGLRSIEENTWSGSGRHSYQIHVLPIHHSEEALNLDPSEQFVPIFKALTYMKA